MLNTTMHLLLRLVPESRESRQPLISTLLPSSLSGGNSALRSVWWFVDINPLPWLSSVIVKNPLLITCKDSIQSEEQILKRVTFRRSLESWGTHFLSFHLSKAFRTICNRSFADS